MKVKKRSGLIQKFNYNKILRSVSRAIQSAGVVDDAKKISEIICERIKSSGKSTIDAEEIASVVEQVLMEQCPLAAKQYIIYRNKRKEIYEIEKNFTCDLINNYIDKVDWRVRENANIAFSLQGLYMYMNSKLLEKFWLYKVFSDDVRKAHETGSIHLHDLQQLAPYCCGWDINHLLSIGIHDSPRNREPKHFQSALGILENILFLIQSNCAGAVAVNHFNTALAPYAYADKLSYREIKQHLQSFIFSMNVPTRVGSQTVFSNITCDLTVPRTYHGVPTLIDKNITYDEIFEYAKIINKALFDIYTEGDAAGRPFTFPIVTVNVTRLDQIDDSLGLLTSRSGMPYYGNFVSTGQDVDDVYSMCCRLRLSLKELHRRGGSLFGAAPSTGSISVVTINLPHIAYQSKDENEFFEHLSYVVEIGRKALTQRRKVIEEFTSKNLYPFVSRYLVPDKNGSVWYNHYSTFGLLGGAEASYVLYKTYDVEFLKRVLIFMNKRILKFQQEDRCLYNVEQTPAEGASYRLAMIDKKTFDNFFSYVYERTGVPVYTNSTHPPVDSDLDLKIYAHSELDPLYTGGTACHLFIHEPISAEDAARLARKILLTKIPYFTITPTFTECHDCKRVSVGKITRCTHCGSENIDYLTRIVGYYRPLRNWNDGKRAEFIVRK